MSLDPWHIFTAHFGQFPTPYAALATLLDMVLYFWVTLNVAIARNKFSIQPPVTTGPEGFLCVMRVQQNTLEQLALHLPLLWIAAFAMDDVFAATLGLVWFFGRTLYAIRYYQKPSRRLKGFAIAMFTNAILFLGALAGT